jgi:hypothetical protein
MIWLVSGLIVMLVAITLFYLRGEDLRKFDMPRPEPTGIAGKFSDQHQAGLFSDKKSFCGSAANSAVFDRSIFTVSLIRFNLKNTRVRLKEVKGALVNRVESITQMFRECPAHDRKLLNPGRAAPGSQVHRQ